MDVANDHRRHKRDIQNTNGNSLCGTNDGAKKDGNVDNSKLTQVDSCVCKTYPSASNINNNMAPIIYNNVYHICSCGTSPNPNNVMDCCTSNGNNKDNCNCCMICKCDCSNGTKTCKCSNSDNITCSSTPVSSNRYNTCYTFDKFCGVTQNNIQHQPMNPLTNHHGPIFIYNSYYYYCQCKSKHNIKHSDGCSTECTCGCQSNTTQSSQETSTPKTQNKQISLDDSHKESKVREETKTDLTKQPHSYAQTKPTITFQEIKISPVKTDSTKSTSNTVTDKPSQPQQTTSLYKTNNQNNYEVTNKQSSPYIDVAELFRHWKK